MRTLRSAWTMTLLAGVVLWSGTTKAQVTGSFDGTVAGPRVTTPLNASAALLQMGPFVTGTLALTMNAPTGDGSACDAVYTGNTTFFVDQVVAQVLDACTTCHVPGGQAATTRFQVTVGDPLATARSMAALVDAANPDASRILQKPLDLLPHGGGVQITAGSAEETILRQWVELVAAANCS